MEDKMEKWEVAYVLPSLNLRNSFETPYIALVPYNDERIKSICESGLSVKKLMNCFIDNYNRKIEPSVLLVNSKAPESIWNNEALVTFRNIVALSVMLKGWADVRPKGSPSSPLFSNSFDFYPITLGKNGGLIYATPAVNDYHSEDSPLVGMPNNYVPQNSYIMPVFDETIYNLLIKVWHQRFIKPGCNNFNSRKIFRSIETAYHALSVPIKNQTTLFDIGVNISLWVSAFEILAHPKNEDVYQTTVLDLIGEHRWSIKELNYNRYRAKISKKKSISVNIAQKLYKELYEARNKFLHGEEVSNTSLFPFKNKNLQQVWTFAPVVYRTALITFLKKSYIATSEKDIFTADNFLQYINESSYEKCLMQLIQNFIF